MCVRGQLHYKIEGAENGIKIQENGYLVTKNIRNAPFFGPVDMLTTNHIHQDVLHIRF